MRWIFFLILPFFLFAKTEIESSLENSQIFQYGEQTYAKDYNRLRLNAKVRETDYPAWRFVFKADNENYYFFKSWDHRGESSIYRTYLEYAGAKHFAVLGKQRVPFGVGRIWNPTDVYNPIDIFAIESDEREGTNALRYEYAPGYLSNIDVTFSREKQAFRIKGYLDVADVALIAVKDTENDRDMAGWEFSGELLDTGLELRSEGGIFLPHREGEADYLDCIFGAEYGFEDSLTLLAEYRYEDLSNSDYFGMTAKYQITPLWSTNLTGIASLNDNGRYVAPVLEYSVSDESTLQAGMLLYGGGTETDLGSHEDGGYVRWFIYY